MQKKIMQLSNKFRNRLNDLVNIFDKKNIISCYHNRNTTISFYLLVIVRNNIADLTKVEKRALKKNRVASHFKIEKRWKVQMGTYLILVFSIKK